MPIIEFDYSYNTRKKNIPVYKDKGMIRKFQTKWFERFQLDQFNGPIWIQEAEEGEYRSDKTSFTIDYVTQSGKLYVHRSSLFDAIQGYTDTKEQRKNTYNFFCGFSPSKEASVYLHHYSANKPVVEFGSFKKKLQLYNARHPATVLRIFRIKSALTEVEKSVCTGEAHKFLKRAYIEEHFHYYSKSL